MSSYIANMLVHEGAERRWKLSESSFPTIYMAPGPNGNEAVNRANRARAHASRQRRRGING